MVIPAKLDGMVALNLGDVLNRLDQRAGAYPWAIIAAADQRAGKSRAIDIADAGSEFADVCPWNSGAAGKVGP